MNDEILYFINQFTNDGKSDQVVDCFTNGNCFWFAIILGLRFDKYDSDLVYDEVMNHFGTKIGDEVYDITGIVTDKYTWEDWGIIAKRDKLHRDRIIRDCIAKKPSPN